MDSSELAIIPVVFLFRLFLANASFHAVASSSGIGPVQVGRALGLGYASTDVTALLDDPSCNTVVIATRQQPASLIEQALVAGKHVFVEKPLCLTTDELSAIEKFTRATP